MTDETVPRGTSTAVHREEGTRVRLVCVKCESSDICRDATARWDESLQQWVLSSLHDTITCQACDYEREECNEVPIDE